MFGSVSWIIGNDPLTCNARPVEMDPREQEVRFWKTA